MCVTSTFYGRRHVGNPKNSPWFKRKIGIFGYDKLTPFINMRGKLHQFNSLG